MLAGLNVEQIQLPQHIQCIASQIQTANIIPV
jgi:hypothetical protein